MIPVLVFGGSINSRKGKSAAMPPDQEKHTYKGFRIAREMF